MEKEYKGITFIRNEKAKDKYSYTAYSKPIKVCSELFDKDSDLVWEEAMKAKEFYMQIVKEQHDKGIKCKGTLIKKESLELAENFIKEKYGNEVYLDVLYIDKGTSKKETPKVVKTVKGDKKTTLEVKPKEVEEKEIKDSTRKISKDFENKTSSINLQDEFDSDVEDALLDLTPVEDMKVDNDNLEDIFNNIEEDKEEVKTKEEDKEDFSVFDLDIDLSDIFSVE